MGFAVGTTCYRAAGEAATAYCAQVQGATSGGVAACQGVAQVAGQTFSVDVTYEASAGTVARSYEVLLPDCEPFDLAGAAPLLWSTLAAAIAILSLRRLAALFNRETL